MSRYLTLIAGVLVFAVAGMRPAQAHCQVPCGIYGDETQFALLDEHVLTIEKATKQIVELSAAGEKNYNQIVRWVNNKDATADALTGIVTYYFLTQRVKPVEAADQAAYAKYQTQLTLLHQIMVSAMKAKQTTDLSNVAALRGLIGQFRESYFGKAEKAHLHEHHK